MAHGSHTDRIVKIPKVGDKATYTIYTDREPCTIIEVSKSGKTCKVQIDKAKVISGGVMDGSAKWEIERDEDGEILTFSLRKNGRWKRKGVKLNERGGSLSIGHVRKYIDPSF